MSEIFLYLVWHFVLPTIEIFIGALWIYEAVHNFKKHEYYMFGVHVLLAIHTAFCLLKIILEGIPT